MSNSQAISGSIYGIKLEPKCNTHMLSIPNRQPN